MNRLSILTVALAAVSCGSPSHQNPFDPATPHGVLSGKVLLQNGAVSESSNGGVSVTITGSLGLELIALSDEAGGFILPDVPQDHYSLTARKVGFLDTTVSGVDVGAGALTTLPADVVLPYNPGSFSGAILVVGAASSGGVTIRASGTTLNGTPYEAITINRPTDGTYLFSGLPAGTYNVSFELVDYATVLTAASIQPGNDTPLPPVSLLRDSGSVVGTATLQGVGDASGIQVSLVARPVVVQPPPVAGAAVTDAGGGWRLDGLPVGAYDVTFQKNGYVTQTGTVTVLSHQQVAAAPVALQATPGVLQGNAFLEGASSGFDGTTVLVEGTVLSTQTLANGSWVINGVGAGALTLDFQRTGFDTQKVQVVTQPGGTLTVADVTLAVSRGNVVGAFRLPLAASSAGVVVTASGPATPTPVTTVTDAAGNFTLAGLPVGSYAITARNDPEWQSATVSGVAVTPKGSTTVPGSPVSLQPIATASISGTALAEGAAATGTTVSLSGQDFRGQAVNATTPVSAVGAWSFGSLVAGNYQVTFTRANYESPAPIGVAVGTGQAVSLGSLTLAASRGSVTGTATATGAASQAGTVVTVSGGPDSASTVTDAAGAYRVNGLRVGNGYTASFSRPAYASATSAAFAVTANANTAVGAATLSLATTGSIAGQVAVERGSIAGIAVSLTGIDVNGAAVTRSTSSNASGQYAFSALPSGTYGLAFTQTSYDPQSLSGLVVTGGAVAAPTVTLLVSRGSIAGQVPLSAANVGGVFSLGADFSGTVVTLAGTDVPIPPAVTDTAGNYRFTGVPVSVGGTVFTVSAQRANFVASAAFPTVTGLGNTTVAVPAITLQVDVGSLSGSALLWDNVANAGANATSLGVAISVTGTAFNGTSFSASTTSGASGAWSVTSLPPGSYDVLAASTNRTCGSYPTSVVPAHGAASTGAAIRCLDALPPSALVLGAPTAPAGAQPGYTTAATVAVPIATPATDPTTPASNFRGYQLAVGPTPDWTSSTVVAGQPASLTFSLPTAAGLPVNGTYGLWARAVDWSGNAGPVAGATVVVDSAAPPVPSITTARGFVNTTTAAVTLAGSDGDPNFLRYEACVGTSSTPTTACSAVPACVTPASLTATPSAYAISLQANARNCVWARAVDKAGNASAAGVAEIVSDLQPPVGPTIAPLYDPTTLTVHADYADFFVTAAATDGPTGGAPWVNVAWIEVDSGSGFTPLCPQDACHAGNTYSPCSCGCTDTRLVCRDGALNAVRVPLLGGVATDVSVRAVDVAGNIGSGAAQQVPVSALGYQVSASAYDEGQPRLRGRLLTFAGKPSLASGYNSLHLVDLGANQLFDGFDTGCEIGPVVGVASNNNFQPLAEPISATAVAYGDWNANALKVRRAGADGLFCVGGDDTIVTLKTILTPYPFVGMVSASLDASGARERVAWTETAIGFASSTINVRDGGLTDGLLGAGVDDVTTTLATVTGYGQVLIAGDTLVYGANEGFNVGTASSFVAVNASGGTFAAGTTTWAFPAAAILAALAEDGKTLAYFANEAGGPTLHVRTAGPDGRFGTADDVDVSRTWTGPSVFDGGLSIRGSHVVLTEAAVSSGAFSIDHWYAGADGRFGTSDDTFARVLPSARPRYWPALGSGLSGGQLLAQSGAFRSNGDVVGYDLSALRWDVAGSAPPLVGPVTNRAGTLLYADAGGTLRARTSDGRETSLLGQGVGGPVAADGGNLFRSSGSSVVLERSDPAPASPTFGQFFVAGAPAPVTVAAVPSARIEAAGGGRAIVFNGSVGGLSLLEPNPTIATPTLIALDGAATGFNFWAVPGNATIDARRLVFSCINLTTFAKPACFREPGGAGGAYGGSDRVGVLTSPANVAYANVFGIATSGNKVAFFADGAGGPHLFVLDAGKDGKLGLNLGVNDDTVVDYGPVADARVGALDLAGAVLAWSTDAGAGQQIFQADVTLGTQRVLTSHFSQKPSVVADPTGRISWLDQVFSTSGIFVSAP